MVYLYTRSQARLDKHPVCIIYIHSSTFMPFIHICPAFGTFSANGLMQIPGFAFAMIAHANECQFLGLLQVIDFIGIFFHLPFDNFHQLPGALLIHVRFLSLLQGALAVRPHDPSGAQQTQHLQFPFRGAFP